MKIVPLGFLIITLLLGFKTYSQDLDSAEYIRRYNAEYREFNLNYGRDFFSASGLSDFASQSGISQLGEYSDFLELRLMGTENYLEGIQLRFRQYLPVYFTSTEGELRFQGWHYGQTIFKYLNVLPMFKNVEMFAGLNVDVGRMTIKGQDLKYKNPFVTFGLSLNPRVIITKRFSVSLFSEYTYDVSKPLWRGLPEGTSFDAGFKKSGLSLQVGLGWILGYEGYYTRIYK